MPAKIAFTDLSVRAIKSPARGQLTVWDKSSPVGVRVSQGGAKTFIVMIGSGQRRTIGRVGIVTLARAREEAKNILAKKTLGIVEKAATILFSDALEIFLAEHYRDKRPRVKAEAKRLLEKHFLPAFRKKPLTEVADIDIQTVLKKLDRVPSEQVHAFRGLRTMLRWCTRPPRRYITHSPLEGYEAPSKDRKGTRTLTDAELVRIWKAGGEGQFGALVRLLILWGTRNGELGRASRSWIDDGVLTIPGECTKNHRPHAIPLLPMARAILDDQPELGDYFFRGRSEGTHFSDGAWGKLKCGLDDASGVSKWQVRDIRRTFRSNMPKLGVSRELCEILLNHVSGTRNELDEIYDRYDYLDEKREALKKWEARIAELLART